MRNSEREIQRHYTRDVLWWFGLFLMVFGELFNFTAYGFAPASVVAPLGTTTIVGGSFVQFFNVDFLYVLEEDVFFLS